MKIAYLLDSTANLRPELASHEDVYKVNLTINFPDGKTYVDSSNEEERQNFYQMLDQSKEFPTTAQPSPGEYINIMEDLIAKGYDQVFGIFVSSGLSGTWQTAYNTMTSFSDQIEVYVIDSKGLSVIMEDMLNQALQLADMGVNGQDLCSALEWIADNSRVIAYIQTLDYIAKSGRLSGVASFVGNLLKIRPVVKINKDGELETIGQARSLGQFLKHVDSFSQKYVDKWDNMVNLAVAHGNAPNQLASLYQRLSDKYPQLKINQGLISAVISCHAGPNLLGMAVVPQYLEVKM